MPEIPEARREGALAAGAEANPAVGRLPRHVEETIRVAREYAEAARAPNTLKAHASDVEDFSIYWSGRSGRRRTGTCCSRDGDALHRRNGQRAGFDPSRYSGYSLRARLRTSASEARVGMEAWVFHIRQNILHPPQVCSGTRGGYAFHQQPGRQCGAVKEQAR